MFRPAFGTVGRILSRRFCSQASSTGARLLHSQRNVVGDAATTAAGRRSWLASRIVITSAWCVGFGLWDVNKVEEPDDKSTRPSEVDWVKAGAVSPVVRKQGSCGCCWAMPVVESVEAVHYIKTSRPISLSVQELIDCNRTNHGCKGGNPVRALWYIWRNGLSSESTYPYMARRSISGCKRDKAVAARISGFEFVDQTEDALEKAVAKQPVIVTLKNRDHLKNYKGGIMEYEAFPPTLFFGGHGVLIVGYGTDLDGTKYWRFKNSWGEGWGEGGFGRICRHAADKRGVLGMFMTPPLYPVLNV